MKKLQKLLSVILALVMVLALTACGGAEDAPAEENTAPEEAVQEEAPAEEAPAEEAAAPDPVYGRSNADATGILELDALKEGTDTLRYATSKEGGYQRPAYEEVLEMFGGVHGAKSEGQWDERYHAYMWKNEDDTARILISFKVQPDGSETWASSNWSDNLE